jgi:hypothetical protein
MDENRISILIKAWETYQNLSKGFGENSWKIRTIGVGFWAATIAYGYKKHDSTILWLSFLIIFMFFTLEARMRQLQQKYIEKSIEIEASINDYLVGDEVQLPGEGISTNIQNPSYLDFLKLFKGKRFLFWFPYVLLVGASIILICIIKK